MLNQYKLDQIFAAMDDAANITENRDTVSRCSKKGDKNFVTAADKGVQEFMEARLRDIMPEADFFAEEDADAGKTAELRWILDPVDGTTNLMHALMHYCISLALAKGDQVIFGAVYNPKTKQLFYAEKSKGSFLRHGNSREKLSVSDVNTLGGALVSIGTSPYYKELADGNFKLFRAIFDRTQDIRRFGSAALDCSYVAASFDDIFVERSLQPWDYAAGSLILTEAGGKITDFDGNPPSLEHTSDILATNGLLHEPMMKLIKETLGAND